MFSSLPLIGELRQHSFTLRLNERNTLTTFEGSFTQQADGTTITGQVAIPSALFLIFLLPGLLLLGGIVGIDGLSLHGNWLLMGGTWLICLLVMLITVINRPSDEQQLLQHVAIIFEAQVRGES
jgi:hypothetical protein